MTKIIRKIGRLNHSKNSYGYNMELNIIRREGIDFYAIGNFPTDRDKPVPNTLVLTELQAKTLKALLDRELNLDYDKDKFNIEPIIKDAEEENEKYYKDYMQQSFNGTLDEHLKALNKKDKDR